MIKVLRVAVVFEDPVLMIAAKVAFMPSNFVHGLINTYDMELAGY